MAIQSSINSLLSQAQNLATFYMGFKKADDIIKDTTATKNEAKIQTDIASGNAPMKDGKVDPEWLQKRRDENQKQKKNKINKHIKEAFFNNDGMLTRHGERYAQFLDSNKKEKKPLSVASKRFYNDPRVQEYLKSFAAKPEMKNEIASDLARGSVEARTDSINKTKSNFNEHTASLIKYYSKGSGNP